MSKGFHLMASVAMLAPWTAQAQTTVGVQGNSAATAADAAAAISQQQEPLPDSTEQSSSLQDIVVTAQRREESLQRVPVAVTALSTESLDQARITNVERLSGFAPNLTVTQQSSSATPVITIRGINSGSANVVQDPKVAVYLDGVYVGRNSGSIFDLADIERVEVLRGPQGTLFGRNATAGAINLVTAAPTGKFSGKLLVSYGNFDALRTRAVVNLPAFGPLSVKLAYLHNEIRGDVRNLIGGRTVDARARDPRFGPFRFADRLGGSNTDAFQAKARLDLGNVLLDYSYDITDSRLVSRGSQAIATIADGGIGPLIGAIYGFQSPNPAFGYAGTGGIANLAKDPQDELASGSSVNHLTVQGHSLVLSWNPSSDLVVKNIASLRYLNSRPFINDITGSGGLRFSGAQLGALLSGNVAAALAPASQPGPGDLFFNIFASETIRQRQFSNELQVSYTGEVFDVTAGGFFFRERGNQTSVIDILSVIPNGVITPSPLDAVFGSGATVIEARNKSYAAYAQATLHITPQLDLTGGIRFTRDEREVTLARIPVARPGALPPGEYGTNFERTNYTGILSYRPNDDITAYAKIATGYVAGGLYAGIPYEPESLTAYELGLKSQFFNNRLRANIAAFYQRYTNLQVQDNNNGIVFVTNAGKARIPGVEVEITALPVDGLTLNGNLGFQDFKYNRYIVGGTDIADVARPLYTSKVTLQLGAQYELPAFSNGARPFVRVDGRYRSKGFISQTPIGATPAEQERLEPLVEIPSFWLVDGRAGITKFSLGQIEADLSGYVQNVFDVRRYDFGGPILSLVAAYNRPRTYGIELSARF